MTEKMFNWFSKIGAKSAPSVCPASRATLDVAEYRILFSASPMRTVSQTTHGSEVQTTTQPFNASVNSQTTYSDGGTANSTATISGEQTTTVVVPTETTISRSSVALYMYTYHVKKGQLELIATDSVVFSRVAASGSGENATGAELGAGIGNLIRASGDRHRADKLYEEALRAISADAQNTTSTVPPLPAPDALPSSARVSVNTESTPSAEPIATLKEHAASGDANAQDALGTLYATGQGVILDDAEAANWFRRAAQQGIDNSQLQLANLYEIGRGVPRDYKQAAEWYRKSADQGDLASQLALGYLYRDGKGVLQNYSQAAYWFQKAAMADYAMAQWSLGDLFEQGQGVPQNYAEAYFWYNLAAAGLSKDGATNSGEIVRKIMEDRGRVEAHLTPSDLSREQERAQKWFEDHPTKAIPQ